jgi:hypothetical protein
MFNSFTTAYSQTIPVEKPTAYSVGTNESVIEKMRRNSRLTEMTSMFKIEQRREKSKGGVIEKGEDLGDNKTSLSFLPFW